MIVTRDVSISDATWVFQALASWERSYAWSAHGATPNLRHVHERLLSAPPWQAVIEDDAHRPTALLQVTEQDDTHDYGCVSLLVAPGARALEGDFLAEALTVAMTKIGVRKLCFSCVEGEMEVGRWFNNTVIQAGRLSRHERQLDGTYADLLMYEVWPKRRTSA